MSTVSRQQYVALYGPTTGDRFRLADTELIAEVERSLLLPGEEAVYGGGKTIRDGMGQIPGLRNADGVLDLVITAVIVMDPMLGHRQGRHRYQGRADRRHRPSRQSVPAGRRRSAPDRSAPAPR